MAELKNSKAGHSFQPKVNLLSLVEENTWNIDKKDFHLQQQFPQQTKNEPLGVTQSWTNMCSIAASYLTWTSTFLNLKDNTIEV